MEGPNEHGVFYVGDAKYGVKLLPDGRPCLAKIATGDSIPADEPTMIFRARDRDALYGAIIPYLNRCINDGCTREHRDGIHDRMEAFDHFATDHPDRMKQPGITRGL